MSTDLVTPETEEATIKPKEYPTKCDICYANGIDSSLVVCPNCGFNRESTALEEFQFKTWYRNREARIGKIKLKSKRRAKNLSQLFVFAGIFAFVSISSVGLFIIAVIAAGGFFAIAYAVKANKKKMNVNDPNTPAPKGSPMEVATFEEYKKAIESWCPNCNKEINLETQDVCTHCRYPIKGTADEQVEFDNKKRIAISNKNIKKAHQADMYYFFTLLGMFATIGVFIFTMENMGMPLPFIFASPLALITIVLFIISLSKGKGTYKKRF